MSEADLALLSDAEMLLKDIAFDWQNDNISELSPRDQIFYNLLINHINAFRIDIERRAKLRSDLELIEQPLAQNRELLQLAIRMARKFS